MVMGQPYLNNKKRWKFMKLKVGYTLEQLLEVYGKKAEIPEALAKIKISIYGLSFIKALKREELWIDTAVDAYLETEEFTKDLQDAEKCWKNRLECNNYWLQLECDKNRKIRLSVDMDMKDF